MKPLVSRLRSRRWLVWGVLFSILVASCGGPDMARREAGAGKVAGEGQPGCGEITRFAKQLVNVAIAYDYEPTESPAELAGGTDVVLAGVLTGGFTAGTRPLGESSGVDSYAGYEVRVDEVIVPDGRIEDGDVVTVSVAYNPTGNDPPDYANDPEEYAAAIAVGAPVVIFAHEADVPGGLLASIEGFATACDGQQPMGWVGGGIGAVNGLGPAPSGVGGPIGWTTIKTLDELVASARQGLSAK